MLVIFVGFENARVEESNGGRGERMSERREGIKILGELLSATAH